MNSDIAAVSLSHWSDRYVGRRVHRAKSCAIFANQVIADQWPHRPRLPEMPQDIPARRAVADQACADRSYCAPVAREDIKEGDIALRLAASGPHVGIVVRHGGDWRVLHAADDAGQVLLQSVEAFAGLGVSVTFWREAEARA